MAALVAARPFPPLHHRQTSTFPCVEDKLSPSSVLSAPCPSSSSSFPLDFSSNCNSNRWRSSSFFPSDLSSRCKLGSWFDGGRTGQQRCDGTCLIFARAGGSRPPPGAKRPRPAARPQIPDEGLSDRPPVNGEISASIVRLVGEDGKLVGTFTTQEALQRARMAELDLVQLDNQDPPCVKIIEYSKYKYELQKKKRERQKRNAANRMDLKELKMRYNIDTHDYDVRLRSAQRFLKDGDKVKFIVQFKGREMEFKDLAIKLFERFQEDVGELGTVECKMTIEGRNMSMVLAPTKVKVQGLTAEKPKEKEGDQVETTAAVVEAR